MVSSFFSGVGVAILAKFVIILVISILAFGALLPVTFVSWLVSLVFNWVFIFIQSVVDFFVHIGEGILRLFGWKGPGTSPPAQATGQVPEPKGQMAESATEQEPDPQPGGGVTYDPGFNPFGSQR